MLSPNEFYMNIQKPIIIVSVGRSGSTLLTELLAKHQNVAWMSKCCQYFPSHPQINRMFLQLTDCPILGPILKNKVHPREHYNFWDYWHKGFSTICRDMRQDDVTQSALRLRDVFAKMTTQKHNRLMIKITGWPRIGFLKEIFPDAKFIHILRDGRSVASSMLNQPWWWGWRGPENWRWGQLTDTQYQLWNKYNKSFVVLAAIEWMILMDSFELATADLSPDTFRTIKYEDLCQDVNGTLKQVADFCELDYNDTYADQIKNFTVRSANSKWQSDLNPTQQHDLQEVLADSLIKYGY